MSFHRNLRHRIVKKSWLLFVLPWMAFADGNEPLKMTLEQAIIAAQTSDPWLQGSRLQQQSLDAQSVAAGQIPDPVVSLDLANLPVDTGSLHQEAMTQMRVGIAQRLPRGDSAHLQSQVFSQEARVQRAMSRERRVSLRQQISVTWLEMLRFQETLELIGDDRHLFEELVAQIGASYRLAAGSTRQQDLIQAELQLSRLDNRILMLNRQRENQFARLQTWLPDLNAGFLNDSLAGAIPTPTPAIQTLLSVTAEQRSSLLQRYLLKHPTIAIWDERIAIGDTQVALSEQNYKPQWTLSAGYGYRDEDPQGVDRADLFSVGVSFDLPLFTGKRQDPLRRASLAQREKLSTDRVLALRGMYSQVEQQLITLQGLDKQLALYKQELLSGAEQDAEASLIAYTNDRGDFTDLVSARIRELDTRIEWVSLTIDRAQAITQLNYLLYGYDRAVSSQSAQSVDDPLALKDPQSLTTSVSSTRLQEQPYVDQ